MGALIAGGGSGAVASSAHAGCTRFRMTDPLLTGRSRRTLASALGHPDVGGKIPDARWVRALAFERMVHDQAFVSELLTRAVGLLELERPAAVRIRSGGDSVDTTATELASAHLAAKHAGEATMLFGLRVPFVELADQRDLTAAVARLRHLLDLDARLRGGVERVPRGGAARVVQDGDVGHEVSVATQTDG